MIIPNVKRNIIANFVARLFGFISTYLFIPIYLKFLGIEAFGLVGFFSTLISVIALVDMGFSATLNRELARLSVRKDSSKEKRDLLRTYELVYVLISSFIVLLIWILAPIISSYWLNSIKLNPHEITLAIRVMGIAIALMLPSGLYFGGLMGLQLQLEANFLQTAWSIFRGGLTVLVLWLFSQTIFAFAFCQLIANAIYYFIIRFSLWRAITFDTTYEKPQFKLQIIQNTWRYTTGIAVIAILSTILTQTDKLAVSKMLSLDLFGYYSLATVLASLPLMLANPVSSAIFPRFTGMFEERDYLGLVNLYHRSCKLTSLVIIPAGVTLTLFAKDFIQAWTSSEMASEQAGLVTSLLMIGQLLQAITLVPFNFALSHGRTKLIIKVQIYSIVLITPVLFLLIKTFGLVGGGLSWLLMNIFTLPLYMYFFHRRFLPGEFKTWILSDIGQPILITLPLVSIGYWFFSTPVSAIVTFVVIGLTWAFSTTAVAFSFSEFRGPILIYIRKSINFCRNRIDL